MQIYSKKSKKQKKKSATLVSKVWCYLELQPLSTQINMYMEAEGWKQPAANWYGQKQMLSPTKHSSLVLLWKGDVIF